MFSYQRSLSLNWKKTSFFPFKNLNVRTGIWKSPKTMTDSWIRTLRLWLLNHGNTRHMYYERHQKRLCRLELSASAAISLKGRKTPITELKTLSSKFALRKWNLFCYWHQTGFFNLQTFHINHWSEFASMGTYTNRTRIEISVKTTSRKISALIFLLQQHIVLRVNQTW